jgi:hypothetical protein
MAEYRAVPVIDPPEYRNASTSVCEYAAEEISIKMIRCNLYLFFIVLKKMPA